MVVILLLCALHSSLACRTEGSLYCALVSLATTFQRKDARQWQSDASVQLPAVVVGFLWRACMPLCGSRLPPSRAPRDSHHYRTRLRPTSIPSTAAALQLGEHSGRRSRAPPLRRLGCARAAYTSTTQCGRSPSRAMLGRRRKQSSAASPSKDAAAGATAGPSLLPAASASTSHLPAHINGGAGGSSSSGYPYQQEPPPAARAIGTRLTLDEGDGEDGDSGDVYPNPRTRRSSSVSNINIGYGHHHPIVGAGSRCVLLCSAGQELCQRDQGEELT